MAKETDNLVLKLLREMRGDVAVLRERADEHSEEFKALRKEIRDWQETTATASGFAMHANIRGQKFEDELAELRRRVDELEKAK
jgi:septal ring factor EnvC (AmiA/AmiB activator)